MKIRLGFFALAAVLPLAAIGCSADNNADDNDPVPGDPGETIAQADEGTPCSADNMDTPDCQKMASDINAAVDAQLGPDDGSAQTADDDDLHFDNTGTGSTGSGAADSGAAPAIARSSSPTTSSSRHAIIARAQAWVAAKVPYSQSKYYAGYRQDCSGFVSMAWQVSKNYNTASFAPYSSAASSRLSDYNSLLPGDALNMQPREHIFLFAGWANTAHTSMYIYEEAHSGLPALYKSVASSYFKSFAPIRKHGL